MGVLIDIELKSALKNLKKREWTEKFTFTIHGRAVPKKRPKIGKRGAYYPKNYTDSQDSLIEQFKVAKGDDWQKPIKVKFDWLFLGSFRGDFDNIIGAYLDAMVKAGIMQDDRLSIVPAGGWDHYPGVIKGSVAIITMFVET